MENYDGKVLRIREVGDPILYTKCKKIDVKNITEEDFKETLEVVNYCKYDNAFTFIYSPRENTPAAKLKDDVSLEEKERRLYELNDTVNKYFLENNKKLEGKIVDVLVEGLSEKKKDNYYGYTFNNKLINFTGNAKIGDIVKVKVTSAKTWSLDGEINE